MKAHILWLRILVIVGSIAMFIGAIDPLEGSIIILMGCGMVTFGTFLDKHQPRVLRYWVWVFILIVVGIGAMWVLSVFGGIGGSTGRSMWWGLVILPYPVGWLMGITSIIVRLINFLKARKHTVQS